jgi:hypothetical protein
MSFANQALCAEYIARKGRTLEKRSTACRSTSTARSPG